MTKPGYLYAYQPMNQYNGCWLLDNHDNRMTLREQGYLYTLSPWWMDGTTGHVITVNDVRQAQGGW